MNKIKFKSNDDELFFEITKDFDLEDWKIIRTKEYWECANLNEKILFIISCLNHE